jgi:hypothetical protein
VTRRMLDELIALLAAENAASGDPADTAARRALDRLDGLSLEAKEVMHAAYRAKYPSLGGL